MRAQKMTKKFFINTSIILTFIFCLPLLQNCSQQPAEAPSKKETQAQKQKFNLGLIPEQDLFSQKERYEPLARYISEKVGLDVELKILSRYGNIIDNFVSDELDSAFFGSFTGALAIKKLGVIPLARPVWLDGSSTYYGMIFVRKDSGIKNGNDMKGKRFAFVDKATTAGWLLPLHFFHSNGIEDYRTWFSETYFTGTHEDAIYDVLNKHADIGAAKNTVFYRLAEKDNRLNDELQILATSPHVPSNTLAVSNKLDKSIIKKLKNTLLQMEQDKQGQEILKKFKAIKFIETTVDDYAPVFEYSNTVSLDLQKYNYMNE
jgi:phosphonate transport system substrate-binding protein